MIEQDEDGWLIATVPAMPGVHTQARTETELKQRIVEAIELYLEVKGPPPTGIRVLRVDEVKVSA